MTGEPGWYPSVDGPPGELQWWDGSSWTGEYFPVRRPQAELRPTPPRHRSRTPQLVAFAIIAVLTWGGLTWWKASTGPPPLHEQSLLPLDVPASAAPAGSTLEDAEEFARAFESERDENRSYVSSAATLADAFGSTLVWYDPQEPRLCSHHDDIDRANVTAWYCSLTPHLITLNTDSHHYPELLYSAELVDTVAHELAHKIIDERCGDTEPGVALGIAEGVTNSYAVLYLGASRDRLQPPSGYESEYTMTDATDRAAASIHSGICEAE
ncbi:DUF2510 domain-containing protein [Demequina sp. B12]|uniref:DUF2510 domain-containing protein n=1 Tax=Demequina sp. B12 TaxID=2992757 RepID=UPI00237B4F2F|nr:DUF2510 domain-containing protein [Demequina sp. B12]MDE0572426.1 DUF2510 domain-containing protein [Demequina sp. B12]